MTNEQILQEDYSQNFDRMRKNRIIVSRYKYGSVKDNYKSGKVSAMENVMDRLSKYNRTGNTEYLLDAANFLMFEFMYPMHSKAHFVGTDEMDKLKR